MRVIDRKSLYATNANATEPMAAQIARHGTGCRAKGVGAAIARRYPYAPPVDDTLALARQLFTAIEQGDAEAVAGCFADAAVVWHNMDHHDQPVAQTLGVLRWMARNVEGLRYDDVRLQATADGFVQQHVLRGTAPGDRTLELHACIVATVADGRITRIDEYLDTKAVETAFS
jgi:ketosteroid isomerase-like protein